MILWSNHHNQKSLFYLSSSWLLLLQRKRERERSFPRRREGVIIQIQVQDFKERPVSFLSLSLDRHHRLQSSNAGQTERDTWERSRWWDFGRKGSQACFSCHSSVFSTVFSTVSWFFLQSLPYNLCLKREEISSSIWVYSQSCDFIDIPRPTKSFVVWEEGRKEIERITVKFPSLSFSMILSFIFPKKRESNDEQRVSCDFYCLSSQKVFDTNSRDREKRDDQWGINKKEK